MNVLSKGVSCDEEKVGFSREEELRYSIVKKKEKKRVYPSLNISSESPYCPRVRRVVIEWLIDIKEEYSLYHTTLHMAVDYMDRFIHLNPIIKKEKIQAVAVVSLLIAAKLEESTLNEKKWYQYCETMGHHGLARYLCADTYTVKELISYEILIVDALEWKFQVLTASHFIPYFFKVISLKEKQGKEEEAYFFITQSLVNYSFCQCNPSLFAVAMTVFTLGREILGDENFSKLETKSGHPKASILAKLEEINQFFLPVEEVKNLELC